MPRHTGALRRQQTPKGTRPVVAGIIRNGERERRRQRRDLAAQYDRRTVQTTIDQSN